MNKKQNFFLTFVCTMLICLLFSSPYTTFAATNAALNKTTDYLVKGETTTLKVTGTSKKVSWSADSKKIATVSTSGKVTAVAYGTTTIKATVNKVTYKCKITVVNPSKIYLDSSSSKIFVGGAAISLNPTSDIYSDAAIKAMNITYKIEGNTGVQISSTGNVTATKAGSFKVTAYIHGKKIETVSMKAVSPFPGFNVSEVSVEVGKYKEVYFENDYLVSTESDLVVKSSDPNVAVAEGAFSLKDLDHYYGIEIEGLKDGTTTLSLTVSGVTKTIKVIVGQGVNVLAPVDAVKTSNYTGYSGNSLTTLKWVRQFIDDNNLDSDTLTDREKITIIQTYLNNNANYNTGNTDYKGYISRILFNGYVAGGDCDAYTSTFCFLCECIDIEVYYCGGAADNGDVYSGHAWNKVKADGTWYYIDTYWNACLQNFDYFLSQTLWSNHTLETEGYYNDYWYTDGEIPYLSDLN